MKRTPLKRKPWRRALGTHHQRWSFKQAVLEADGGCVMVGRSLCRGDLQAAHIIPKRKLRDMGYGAEIVYSVDAAFTACEGHHIRHDCWVERIPDSLIPERCRRFAVQYGRPAA